MTNHGNIIEVNETDFEFQVIAYSQQIPVIVEFWADWCAPCRVLGPLLEQLAKEANGSFRLAKLNVDENPNLAKRLNIRTLPTVQGIQNGQLKAEFTGVITESQLRDFIQRVQPDETTLNLEKGLSLFAERDLAGAEEALRSVLREYPGSPKALLGLTKVLLLQGHGEEALELLTYFPIGKEMNAAETLQPLAKAVQERKIRPDYGDEALDAAYDRAVMLFERGNIPAALDGLLSILSEDKRYRDGEVRRVVLGIFELLGEKDPLTIQYRRELANLLF